MFITGMELKKFFIKIQQLHTVLLMNFLYFRELAQKMKQAGVEVTRKVYPGVTHEFFGMAQVLDQAEAAQNMAADQLKQAFTAKAQPALTDAR